jgi:hypothetical protein
MLCEHKKSKAPVPFQFHLSLMRDVLRAMKTVY